MYDDRTERALGPYRHRRRYRVVLVGADGRRVVASFAEHATAQARVDEINAKAGGRTVSAAVDEYVEHLRARDLRPSTIATIEYRLAGLLDTAGRDRDVRSLTAAVAASLFASRACKTSADTQHGELAAASAFAAWCVKRGTLARDPFAELAPIGRRATGKPRLRIDEARQLLDACLAEAHPSGLATAIALTMGLRASEITDRVVRDADDGARVLWIERAKTRAGDRRLEVPEVLRPRLAALCAGRSGGDRLFGDVDRHWLGYHVRRLCGVAEVPVVPPHGLRGTWSSIAAEAMPVEHVARALGQVHGDVTRRHYLAAGSEQIGQQRAALRVLRGGGR